MELKSTKSPALTLFFALSIFPGSHSFYLGHKRKALFQVFTLNGFMFWGYYEAYLLLTNKLRDKENNLVTFKECCPKCRSLDISLLHENHLSDETYSYRQQEIVQTHYDSENNFIGTTTAMVEKTGTRSNYLRMYECNNLDCRNEWSKKVTR